jgi:beta-lactamase regulating signal transducer with metallopeptidase domain
VSYYGLGAWMALAEFAVVNAAGCLMALGLWRALQEGRLGAARRARAFLVLRMLPVSLSTAIALGLVLPAYLRFEPRHSDVESCGPILALLTAGAVAILVRSVLGLWVAIRATQAQASKWMTGATRIDLGHAIPSYRIRHSFPCVAVLGFLRPRLFVAAQVMEGLGASELAAVIDHEAGHLVARDNLKRLLVRACPDWLTLLGLGRRLEAEWVHASEAAADEYAVRRACDPEDRAMDLASALLKVARMTAPEARLLLPAGALHDGDSVAERVTRLARIDTAPAAAMTAPEVAIGLLLAGVSVAGLAVALDADALRSVHEISEALVHLLG